MGRRLVNRRLGVRVPSSAPRAPMTVQAGAGSADMDSRTRAPTRFRCSHLERVVPCWAPPRLSVSVRSKGFRRAQPALTVRERPSSRTCRPSSSTRTATVQVLDLDTQQLGDGPVVLSSHRVRPPPRRRAWACASRPGPGSSCDLRQPGQSRLRTSQGWDNRATVPLREAVAHASVGAFPQLRGTTTAARTPQEVFAHHGQVLGD